MSLVRLRINPDGKEFSAQIAGLGFVEADVADVVGIGAADVKAFIEKTLRRVGVRINDEGRIVYCLRSRADCRVLRSRTASQEQKSTAKEYEERKTAGFLHGQANDYTLAM